MTVNQSKKNDPRFWKKWRESGAVGTMRDAQARSEQDKKYFVGLLEWTVYAGGPHESTHQDVSIIDRKNFDPGKNAYDVKGVISRIGPLFMEDIGVEPKGEAYRRIAMKVVELFGTNYAKEITFSGLPRPHSYSTIDRPNCPEVLISFQRLGTDAQRLVEHNIANLL